MAGELSIIGYDSGATVVVRVYTEALVQVGADITAYEVANGNYLADMPVGTPAATYVIGFYDGGQIIADGTINWDGTKEVSGTEVQVLSSNPPLKIKTSPSKMKLKLGKCC